jgi:flagellin-like protein
MKGITPIIAIIVLLLITVALAGVAWSYLQGYMGGLTGKSVEVRDYFCITNTSGNFPNIVVANIGTEAVTIAEILVINASTGAAITNPPGSWTLLDGTGLTGGTIPIKGAAKWTSPTQCTSGLTCSYRIMAGTGGRTQRVSVVC